MFTEFAVIGAKGGVSVAVDVEFADDFSVSEDRNDDFGFCFNRAGEIARIVVDVIHNECFPAGSRRAADSLIQRNARVRSRCSTKRSENEHVWIIGVNHVKAHPVVASELFVEQRNYGIHQGVGAGRVGSEFVEFRDK